MCDGDTVTNVYGTSFTYYRSLRCARFPNTDTVDTSLQAVTSNNCDVNVSHDGLVVTSLQAKSSYVIASYEY